MNTRIIELARVLLHYLPSVVSFTPPPKKKILYLFFFTFSCLPGYLQRTSFLPEFQRIWKAVEAYVETR